MENWAITAFFMTLALHKNFTRHESIAANYRTRNIRHERQRVS